jgi:Spy/CpxP family protein refolding chaperone
MAFKRHLLLVATATLVSAGSAVGCGGGSTAGPPPSNAQAATTAAEDESAGAALADFDRHHHHGGVTLLIAMSLDVVGITPDQKTTIEQIRTDLRTALQPSGAAEGVVLKTLADGIASGSVDTAKVDAAIGQLTTASGSVHDACVAALNQLHGVFSAEQRAAFVDKVQAQWDVWQDANALETPAYQAKADADRLDALSDDLSLTPDQLAKIRASASSASPATPPLDAEEVAARIRRFCDAFRAETFDARSLTDAGATDARVAEWGAMKMAHFLEAATPALTPDQRTKLAQILRDHAAHGLAGEGA